MLRRSLLLILLLAGCNLQTGQPTVIPTPDIPQIEFQEPANNDSIIEGTDVSIALVARDDGIGVARVELLVDDLPAGEAFPQVSGAVPIFTVTMNWLAAGIGFHSMTATAYRPDGTPSRAAVISILVTASQDA